MSDSDGPARPRTLIIDDEPEVADAYALRLREDCAVQTTYDGQSAIEHVQDEEIDIILLDRHMPGMSGDEVLATLNDQAFAGKVIMVTAIDPGFDVLDMAFDDYLCKPIDRDDLRTAVAQQVTVLGYETLGTYFGKAATKQVLEAELPTATQANRDRYTAISAELDDLRNRLYRLLEDPAPIIDSFTDIQREGR